MMKKLLSLGLILCILVGLFGGMVTVQAANSGSCGENVSYTYSGGVLTISGSGPMTEYDNMDDVPWDSYRDSIEEVVVEEGVTALGDWSIYNMDELRKVTLPQSLKRLETAVFCFCKNLAELTLPDSIEFIGNLAVTDLPSLTRINVPDSLREMGGFEAGNYTELINLQEVIIDPEHPFVKYQDGMLIYRDNGRLFSGCAASGDVVIPQGVTIIDDSAFIQNNRITTVSVAETVTEIGAMCFYRCENLTGVYLPGGLKEFGYEVFGACDMLSEVRFGGTQSQWDSIEFQADNMTSEDEGLALANELLVTGSIPYKSSSAPAPEAAVTEAPAAPAEEVPEAPAPAAVPAEIRGVCGDAVEWEFVEYYDAETGEDQSYLTIYGYGSMYDYWDGTDAPWASVIGKAKQIIVDEGVTAIGDNAFTGSVNLESAYIGSTVTAFGENCFNDCPFLEIVAYQGTQEQWQQVQVEPDNDILLMNLFIFDPEEEVYYPPETGAVAEPETSMGQETQTPAQTESAPVVTKQEESLSPVTIILVAVVAVLVVAITAAIIVIVVVLKRTKPQPATPVQTAEPAQMPQPEQPVVTQTGTQGFYSQYRDQPTQYNREE